MTELLPYLVAIIAGLVSGLSARSVIQNEIRHVWDAIKRIEREHEKHESTHRDLWTAVNDARQRR